MNTSVSGKKKKKKKDTRDIIKEHIKKLIIEEYYLPYGHVLDLHRIPESKLCGNVECIKNRAISILTSTDKESEIYRQLIYILSTHTAITGLAPYILARIRAEMIEKSSTTAALEHYYTEVKLKKDWWNESGYKKAVECYGDLIQLNFAFSPISAYMTATGILESEMSQARKTLVATLQSRLLRIVLPFRPFEITTVRNEVAELIINFSIELRRKVIEGFLKFRPRKVSDIFNYVYQWARVEAYKLEKFYSGFSAKMEDYIYEELFIAPYYLNYYGIININFFRYDLFWEISE
jgi:hypothetical protein